jgi:hypothetical protein
MTGYGLPADHGAMIVRDMIALTARLLGQGARQSYAH